MVHFAAESHVDCSILDSEAFLRTPIGGTFEPLKVTHAFYETLIDEERDAFPVSSRLDRQGVRDTCSDDPAFHEETPYAPNSPYAVPTAASYHLVRAWIMCRFYFLFPVTSIAAKRLSGNLAT